MLVDFLNENSKDIEFKKKCNCCQDISFPENIYKFSEEISNTKDNKICRYDIAGIDETDTLLFGIEIFHSHRAENTEVRNTLPWVEINADEIIEKLDLKTIKVPVIFNDIFCSKSNSEINIKISELSHEELHSEIITKYRKCSECNRLNILVSEPSFKNKCKDCYFLKESKEYDLKKTYDKISMTEIAELLGYVSKDNYYSCRARREIEKAIKGSYFDYTYYWSINQNDDEDIPDKRLWYELIKRNKCMKCERKHHVSKYKPYCGNCYKIIKEDDIYTFSEKIFITEEEKRILRNKLNFLYDIKKYKDCGLTCSICINKYKTHEKREDYYSPGSNYVYCKLWYMNLGNLSICDICLENEMVKRSII